MIKFTLQFIKTAPVSVRSLSSKIALWGDMITSDTLMPNPKDSSSSSKYAEFFEEEMSRNPSLNSDYIRNVTGDELAILMRYSRKFFLYRKFLDDHPDTMITIWHELEYVLINRENMRGWYDDAKEEWSLMTSIPDWLTNNDELRENWKREYQQKLVDMKNAESEASKLNNQARKNYDAIVSRNNESLKLKQDELYRDNPVLLIHRIQSSALSEADIITLSKAKKEERRILRKKLVTEFKLSLYERYKSGELSVQDLFNVSNFYIVDKSQ